MLQRCRAAVTGDPADTGAFKTPTLRGVRLTAPYMHDGRFASLRQVLVYYRSIGANTAIVHELPKLDINDREMDELEAFLRALAVDP